MEISKINPAPAVPAAGAPGSGSALERQSGAGAGVGAVSPALGEGAAATLLQTVSREAGGGIRSLDVASALKILIAEVRLALVETQIADPVPDVPGASGAHGPDVAGFALPAEEPLPQAARALVDLLLSFAPSREMPAETLQQSVASLRQAMDAATLSAIERVAAWRDTPPSVTDSLRQAQALAADAIMAGITEEGPAGILTRPEWLGLAPRLALLRRRLRRRRLLLTDTDADHLDIEPDGGPNAGRR